MLRDLDPTNVRSKLIEIEGLHNRALEARAGVGGDGDLPRATGRHRRRRAEGARLPQRRADGGGDRDRGRVPARARRRPAGRRADPRPPGAAGEVHQPAAGRRRAPDRARAVHGDRRRPRPRQPRPARHRAARRRPAASRCAELRDELAALRAVAARPVVTVEPLVEAPFLGEPVPLLVTVVDADGEPAVDAAVDLVASWGRLRASDGYSVDEGAALTVRTDIFGRAEATLTPPTSEDLQDVQQAALETSLATLDHSAPTPAEAADGLRELARQYRWEAAYGLRHAVDVYFRDFRPRLLDTVNFRDYLVRWTYLESTVSAAAVTTTSVDAVRDADRALHGLAGRLARDVPRARRGGQRSRAAGSSKEAGRSERRRRDPRRRAAARRRVRREPARRRRRVRGREDRRALDARLPRHATCRSCRWRRGSSSSPRSSPSRGRSRRSARPRSVRSSRRAPTSARSCGGGSRRAASAASSARSSARGCWSSRRPRPASSTSASRGSRPRRSGRSTRAWRRSSASSRRKLDTSDFTHAADARRRHRAPRRAVKASQTLELQEQAEDLGVLEHVREHAREFDAPEPGTPVVVAGRRAAGTCLPAARAVRARHRRNRRGDRGRSGRDDARSDVRPPRPTTRSTRPIPALEAGLDTKDDGAPRGHARRAATDPPRAPDDGRRVAVHRLDGDKPVEDPSVERRSAARVLGEFTDRRFAVRPANVQAVSVRSYPDRARASASRSAAAEPAFFWRAEGEIGKPAATGDPAASPPPSAGVVDDGAALAERAAAARRRAPPAAARAGRARSRLRVGRAVPRPRRLVRDRLPRRRRARSARPRTAAATSRTAPRSHVRCARSEIRSRAACTGSSPPSAASSSRARSPARPRSWAS